MWVELVIAFVVMKVNDGTDVVLVLRWTRQMWILFRLAGWN